MQLRNFESGYETTAAKKSTKLTTYVIITIIQSLFKITWEVTILFEDTVHPEGTMPFWKLQFNMNYKTAIFVVCAHDCCVYGCIIYLFDMHNGNYGIIARNKLLLRMSILFPSHIMNKHNQCALHDLMPCHVLQLLNQYALHDLLPCHLVN